MKGRLYDFYERGEKRMPSFGLDRLRDARGMATTTASIGGLVLVVSLFTAGVTLARIYGTHAVLAKASQVAVRSEQQQGCWTSETSNVVTNVFHDSNFGAQSVNVTQATLTPTLYGHSVVAGFSTKVPIRVWGMKVTSMTVKAQAGSSSFFTPAITGGSYPTCQTPSSYNPSSSSSSTPSSSTSTTPSSTPSSSATPTCHTVTTTSQQCTAGHYATKSVAVQQCTPVTKDVCSPVSSQQCSTTYQVCGYNDGSLPGEWGCSTVNRQVPLCHTVTTTQCHTVTSESCSTSYQTQKYWVSQTCKTVPKSSTVCT